MEYCLESIQKDFRLFWKSAKDAVSFKLNGKAINPESIPSFQIQINEGDFGDGYNFQCQSLDLKILIDNCERRYKADFIIKVVPISVNNGKPTEKIVAIKDNCIYLKAL